MSLYERGHGSNGEGGAKGGVFYSKRYALSSGLNSPNLEFLPLNNVEEIELDPLVAEMLGAVPIGMCIPYIVQSSMDFTKLWLFF